LTGERSEKRETCGGLQNVTLIGVGTVHDSLDVLEHLFLFSDRGDPGMSLTYR